MDESRAAELHPKLVGDVGLIVSPITAFGRVGGEIDDVAGKLETMVRLRSERFADFNGVLACVAPVRLASQKDSPAPFPPVFLRLFLPSADDAALPVARGLGHSFG